MDTGEYSDSRGGGCEVNSVWESTQERPPAGPVDLREALRVSPDFREADVNGPQEVRTEPE
jgi:hypothetical protein